MRSVFRIGKMDCPTEEQIIRNRLKGLSGINDLQFDLMNRRLTVDHGMEDPMLIQRALESVGMDPQPIDGEEQPSLDDHGPIVPVINRWLMGSSGVLAVGAEVVAWTTGKDNSLPVIAMAIGSILFGGRDTLRKGVTSLRTLTLNINFLMTIAIIGAASIGQWPEAAMVTFLFGVAEMIEALSLDRARHAIRSLMELSPERALVQIEGKWREVPAAEVEVGSLVRVRPGERVPLDGIVESGESWVNQGPITGESMPVQKGPGDQVFAGTINDRGVIEFNVTARAEHTTLSRIIRAVQQAQGQKAPTQRFVDTFARYYTPIVVVLALLISVVPPIVFAQPFQAWLYKALVLLVIACPCALVISTPVTVVSALAASARRGILVKGGAYVEAGHRLDLIALDKTGTITHGTPTVTDVIGLEGVQDLEVLRLAASLDSPSEHPVASAIVEAYDGDLMPISNFESITGRGVKGRIDGKLYFLGNHRLAHEENYCGPSVEDVLERLESEGKTVVVLGVDGKALGVLAVADTIRASSVEAIRELHELGVRTLMLTGDNERTAKAIAREVGIDDARGDLLPEDKLQIIEELTASKRHIGMVGDGINDAPALARATLGFAMGAAGTDTAIETADVALMQDDLRKIPEFLRISRRASQILVQNIAFSIGIKVIFFVLAFLGVATLWMAVFADLGASLLVVGNGLRLLRANGSGPVST